MDEPELTTLREQAGGRREVAAEGLRTGEVLELAEELEFARVEGPLQLFEEQPAEQT